MIEYLRINVYKQLIKAEALFDDKSKMKIKNKIKFI